MNSNTKEFENKTKKKKKKTTNNNNLDIFFGHLSFEIKEPPKRKDFLLAHQQLDNFKRIATQTIILFKLFNFFKTNKKIQSKQSFYSNYYNS